MDRQLAALGPVADLHLETQNQRHLALQSQGIRIFFRPSGCIPGSGRLRRALLFFHQLFGLAHIQSPAHHGLGQSRRIIGPQQGAPMAGAELVGIDQFLDPVRQVEQTQRVSHMRAAFAQTFGQPFLGVGELIHQDAVAFGFVERRKILSLQIFDHGDFQGLLVVQLPLDDRHFVELGQLGGPPAPFPGDDLVALFAFLQPAHQDGLKNALAPNGFGQLIDLVLIHALARLIAPGLKELDGHGLQTAGSER